jgi:uncharacterized membrane protein
MRREGLIGLDRKWARSDLEGKCDRRRPMAPFIEEWLNLLVRWVHVIAAIMWVGDSFLFMWLDSQLVASSKPREGAVLGEIWMAHSGGFYEVVKRKSLSREELPAKLHWFKWESYGTWLTGFLLLVIVYHLSGASLLIDPRVMQLEHWEAVAISLSVLPLAYGLYEVLWMLIGDRKDVFAVVGLALIAGFAFVLTRVFSARGAFLQVGATLGTVMAANVFFRIIPAQKHMLGNTAAGLPVDTSYGLRAKGRSVHNHYLTLPVLFCMLSNHFPSVYSARFPWLMLALLVVGGAGLKFAMNKRLATPRWALAGTLLALGTVIVLTHPPPDHAADAYAGRAPVKFETVAAIVQLRCTTCHQEHPYNGMFNAPPNGIRLDTPEEIREHRDRIFVRAVETRSMPLANMTGITEDERALLGAWYAQGGEVPRGSVMPASYTAPPPASDEEDGGTSVVSALGGGTPDERAGRYFKGICAGCHGMTGLGNGTAAAALNPKPRNFTDVRWQGSVTDAQIRTTILKGGAAVGKSALMPPQPTLGQDPQTLDALVKLVRSCGATHAALETK